LADFGTVKFWRAENGWGFIIPDAYGPDVFANVKDVEHRQNLQEGMRVSFVVAYGRDGRPQAKLVKPVP
jgi:CspA family cold shock protein